MDGICLNLDDDLFSDLTPGEELHLPLVPPEEDNEPARSTLTPWPSRLPMELALGVEPEAEILNRYSITQDQYETLKHLPAFRRALAAEQKDVRENGLVFPSICRRMASEFLEDIYLHFFDERTTINMKHELLKSVAKYGGLEPVVDKNANQGAIQVNIQINGL